MKRLSVLVSIAALTLAVPAQTALAVGSDSSASAAIPKLYKNCTALNKKYPHGLGKAKARDKTSGTPVTNFKRSTKLYKVAMSHNGRLDGDKDGVACEKS